METLVLSGIDASKSAYDSLPIRINALKEKKLTPGLAVILVGENPASKVYVKSKSNRFSKLNLFSDTFTSGKQALDLCLMTLCEKQIIANSTFSWWGAYLSSQKVVLTPKEWFKNTNYSDRDTSDLYPNNWKQVEN